jgi:hypothetical protein
MPGVFRSFGICVFCVFGGHKVSRKPPPRSRGHKPIATRPMPRDFCFSSGRFWPEYRVTDLYLSTMKNCVLRAWLLTGPEVERHL